MIWRYSWANNWWPTAKICAAFVKVCSCNRLNCLQHSLLFIRQTRSTWRTSWELRRIVHSGNLQLLFLAYSHFLDALMKDRHRLIFPLDFFRSSLTFLILSFVTLLVSSFVIVWSNFSKLSISAVHVAITSLDFSCAGLAYSRFTDYNSTERALNLVLGLFRTAVLPRGLLLSLILGLKSWLFDFDGEAGPKIVSLGIDDNPDAACWLWIFFWGLAEDDITPCAKFCFFGTDFSEVQTSSFVFLVSVFDLLPQP